MRELALPVFDRHTLPGSTYIVREREDGRAERHVSHVRSLDAPHPSIWIAQPDELEAELRMAAYRKQARDLMAQLDRGIDPRMVMDYASAVVLRGNWIVDGTTFTNSVTENVIGFSPQFAGSGAAIETITSAAEAAGGFWYPGRAIRMFAELVVSSAASAPGNLTLNWRLDTHTGNSVGGASAANALAVSMVSVVWQMELWLVCRTITAAGTLEGSSRYNAVLSATQTAAPTLGINGGHNVAIDTTANHNICATVLFSAASTSNIVGLRQLFCEVLN